VGLVHNSDDRHDRPKFIVGKGATGVFAAAEAAALLIAAVARKRTDLGLTLQGLLIAPACPLCRELYAAFPRLFSPHGDDFTIVSWPTPSLVTILCASTLAEYSHTETFNSRARIIVYGTQLSDTTKFAPAGFELMMVFNRGSRSTSTVPWWLPTVSRWRRCLQRRPLMRAWFHYCSSVPNGTNIQTRTNPYFPPQTHCLKQVCMVPGCSIL